MSFVEGDIFYTVYDQKFHLYKLLRSEDEYGTYHVLGYVPLDELPSVERVHELDIAIHHFPIASDGFEGATFFSKSEVSEDDLMGYRVYLDQIGN